MVGAVGRYPATPGGSHELAAFTLQGGGAAANAAVTNFPAAPVWTSATVFVMLNTNVVYVFGTNMFGAMTNDVITIFGVPEAGAACGIVLWVALALRKRRTAA